MTNQDQSITIYYYWDCKYDQLSATTCNYWHSSPAKENRTYSSEHALYYLLENRQEMINLKNFDPSLVKISGLEARLAKDLADSHIRQQKLKDQIAELKCIGHDGYEPNGGFPLPPSFDDDIPF